VCRRNICESLTARIFLLTLLLLLGAGGLTFGLIAWATPITYVSVVGDRLQVQVSELTDRLALTKLADAGPILDVFVRESGAAVSLASPDGESVDTGSLYVSVTTAVQESDSVSTYTYGADGGPAQRERAGHYVTTALSDALIAEVTFADRAETYQLLVVPPMRLANQAVEALNRAAPCLALALLAFSLLCAVGYSRYLARPIVRISSIAGRMAELDFQWKCGETRRDEIGALGRSLDEMAERLSAALAELEEANAALRGDMERARELERQRLAFFSAASHELKTPVTILKGQLSGMLDGVGVYRDREKYLARSLQVAGRMEALVGELLAVSRMESDGAPPRGGARPGRHSLRRRALARARATAPSRAGGSSSGASRRALYSSMRSMAQTSSVRCSFNRDRALRWRVDTVPGGMSRAWAVSARVRPWK